MATRGTILHKLMEEVLTGETQDSLAGISGIPGIQKVRRALRNQRPVSATAYLKTTPTAFGFTGVFRRLACGIGVLTEEGLLDDGGYELVTAWARDQHLDGIIGSEVTSRSNWANDSSTFSVSRPIEVVVLNYGVAVRSHRDHGRDQRIKTARQQKCRIRGQNDTPLLALSSSRCNRFRHTSAIKASQRAGWRRIELLRPYKVSG